MSTCLQFGVGFYSAFLVADRVTVQTKSHEDDKQWVWEATAGSHQYKVKEDTSAPITRGTKVTLHLKEDAQELADPVRLARLIKQYSQFISFPIKLFSMRKEPIKVADDEATKRKQEQADQKAKEKGEETKPVSGLIGWASLGSVGRESCWMNYTSRCSRGAVEGKALAGAVLGLGAASCIARYLMAYN